MNHFQLSIYKSIIRLCGSIGAICLGLWLNVVAGLVVLGASYGIAEILGILEEIFDKRKEE